MGSLAARLPGLQSVFPFLRWLPRVNAQSARADLIAGLTGAVVVLPQGVAFATIAGMPPEYGLYAAMVPAIVAALFGSSWHLVSGPTTAISIVVFATVSPLAEPGSEAYVRIVLTMTFLMGAFQLFMGLARMGTLVNFISHTVVVGFTAGAGILIIASQIKNFFGIAIPRGAHIPEIATTLVQQAGDINPYITAVALFTLAAAVVARRFLPRLPYMIIAMVAGSLLAVLMDLLLGSGTGIATVGALPATLPPLSQPDLSLSAIKATAGSALAVTILGLTEAVSIARAIAVKSEQRIDGNQEFIGQGLSNMAGSFFSAYASSGSFNRSGLNYEAGARTPLASVLAAVFLAGILLLVAPLAAYLPIPPWRRSCSWWVSASSISTISAESSGPAAESLVLAVTFFGTLFLDLEFAIFAGVLLSLVLYLNRTSRPTVQDVKPATEEGAYHFSTLTGLPDCPQFKMVRIHGSLFFGAVDHVGQTLQSIDEENPDQKHVLIVASRVNFVDVAGAEMLVQEARRRKRAGGGLYVYRLRNSAVEFLRRGHYLEEIGAGNVFPVRTDVIGAVYPNLDPEICRNCSARIFRRCRERLPNGEPRPDAVIQSPA